MAIKLLAYGDAGAATGFERVLRNVMTYLHNTGKFDIAVQGLGYRGGPEFKYPYDVWPAERGGDFFGASSVHELAERHKADAMFVVQDLWNVVAYMSYKPVELPAVTYFPVDTPNVKWSYAVATGAIAEPVAYTQFGARETAAGVRDALDLLMEGGREHGISPADERTWLALPHPSGAKLQLRLDRLGRFQNPENWNVIPHGLDRTIYRPLDKKAVRREWNLNPGDFIIGAVNTNQFRKRQDVLFRLFAAVRTQVPNAKLLVYANNSDERGWDLPQLARHLGITSSIYLLHEQIDRDLTEQEMCELYNACDLMVNTAGGEGWGLTSFEGAACGVPQAVPDWSATRELWAGHGVLLPVADWRYEPKFLNTAHALVDVKASAQMIVELAKAPEKLSVLAKLALEHANAQPSWTDVGKQFERVIYRAVNQSRITPTPRSFATLLAERVGDVQSELAGAMYVENGKIVRSTAV